MNMHESYVNLETAKLLKEVGFDWECIRYYQNDDETLYGPLVEQYKLVETNFNVAPVYMNQYSAPTHAVAQRWLREVKRHDVFVFPCNGLYFYTVRKYYHEGKVDYFDYPNKDAFDTYELAFETGIKTCLILIKNTSEDKNNL